MQVSTIVPAYNAQNYIDGCLESVRAQTLGDIEIFVIDDGSTDETQYEAALRSVEENEGIEAL